MIMGMLWISTSSYGVTARHIVDWVKNGSLPLLNAFDFLLGPQKQKNLKAIAPFFRHPILPTEAVLKRTVLTLHVACGYKPPTVQLLSSKISKEDVELRSKALMIPGRLIRPSNVPLVCANMIADLGLSQKVLDYSLSMMGYPVTSQGLMGETIGDGDSNSKEVSDNLMTDGQKAETTAKPPVELWLPPALQNARPDRLNETSRILAVVVAACKMITPWNQNITYKIQLGTRKTEQEVGSDFESKRSYSEQQESRFIPWNHDHFCYIGNGKTETDYLDFMESTLLFSNHFVLPNFVKSLRDTNEQKAVVAKKPVVSANSTVLRVGRKKKSNLQPSQKNDSAAMEAGNEKQPKAAAVLPGAFQQIPLATKSNAVKYRLTTSKEAKNARIIDPPLGPMIEHFACKIGCRPDQTLEYLIRLDMDLSTSNRTCSTSKAPIRLHPERLLDAAMTRKVAKEL
jgi:hypothetical protein